MSAAPERLVIVGTCSTGEGAAVGGSGQTARRIFRGLRDLGHEIHTIGIGSSPSFLEDFGITYHSCDQVEYDGLWPHPNHVFPLAEKVARVAIENRADVLHAHYLFPWGWAVWEAQRLIEFATGRRVSVVQRPAGTDVTIHGAHFPLLLRALLTQANANIINTRTFAEEVARVSTLGDHLRYEQIYNPIPDAFERGAPALREVFGISPAQVVVGVVGNFRRVKGAPYAIEIFNRFLRSSGLDAVLLMIGNGADARRCRASAAELGILDRVLWVGRLDRMAPAYSSLDILLHPSSYESFGLVLGEAARCRVPCVASNVGSIPEVVSDGETGFLCPSNDLDAFVVRLTELARDRALRERMGQAAEARTKRLFNLSEIVAAYEDVFLRVVRDADETIARCASRSQ